MGVKNLLFIVNLEYIIPVKHTVAVEFILIAQEFLEGIVSIKF